jgi:hypothetical protein
MATNGRLSRSTLAPIPGPTPGSTCYLRKDAAAAWNAMNEESKRRYGITLRPLGMMSAYRTYDQQVYLWNTVAHAHDPNWVARPGTSNHGWGIAVDLQTRQMRWVIDQIGRKYGYAKAWSDAPVEWWHIRYRPGVWKGKTFKPLRHNSQGPRVKWVQRRLRSKGFKSVPGKGKKGYGFFGKTTVSAVKRFQKAHKLKADGVVGPTTWRALAR